MADKKTVKMAEFYRQCKKKGYLNMRSDTESLKAKVIAEDMGLRYGDMTEFFEKARACHEQLLAEEAEQSRLDEERRRREAEEAARRAVPGTLLVTLSDKQSDRPEGKVMEVYLRPDGSFYTTLGGKKTEGVPTVEVHKGGVLTTRYHPSKAVYTGATVGGITTGGVHYTKESYSQNVSHTGKGYIEVRIGDSGFTLALVVLSQETRNRFRRDDEVRRVTSGEKIRCWRDSGMADMMLQAAVASGVSHMDRMDRLSMAVDEKRISYNECANIANLLRRIFRGDFPPEDRELYHQAEELAKGTSAAQLLQAVEAFERIKDYQDAGKRAAQLRTRYEEVLQQEKEQAVLRKEARRRRNKRLAMVLVPLLALLVLWTGFQGVRKAVRQDEVAYQNGINMLENRRYERAVEIFEELGDYKDSAEKLKEARAALKQDQSSGGSAADDGRLPTAEAMPEVKPDPQPTQDGAYNQALVLENQGKYKEAAEAFARLEEFRDSKDRYKHCSLQYALRELVPAENYKDAYPWLAAAAGAPEADALLKNYRLLPASVQLQTTSGSEQIFYFGYDETGRMIRAYRSAYNALYPSYQLDEAGRIVKAETSVGTWVDFIHGTDGTITKTKADGKPNRLYDKNGNVICFYDTKGERVDFHHSYDERGNIYTENASSVIQNTYGSQGELLSVYCRINAFQSMATVTYDPVWMPDRTPDMAQIWQNFRIVCEEIW